jgi:hypothetical protein
VFNGRDVPVDHNLLLALGQPRLTPEAALRLDGRPRQPEPSDDSHDHGQAALYNRTEAIGQDQQLQGLAAGRMHGADQ